MPPTVSSIVPVSGRDSASRTSVYRGRVSDIRPALVDALDEAIEILSVAGEDHWRRWLEEGRRLVLVGDLHATTHLLRAFGGMGSFNDLVLSPRNGHLGDAGALQSADDHLNALRDTIWTACGSLERSDWA
jgi:hypothetical protein